MGRVAVAFGMPDDGTGILDRSADGVPVTGAREGGTPSLVLTGAGALLSGPVDPAQAWPAAEEPGSEWDATMNQVWYQLTGAERERFGHCFSVMVLKALGLCSCGKEVGP
jgi:hypothetical protein